MADSPTPASTNKAVDYRFRSMIDRGEWVVSVEVDPPKAMDLERGVRIVERLQEAGVDCIKLVDQESFANPIMSCLSRRAIPQWMVH